MPTSGEIEREMRRKANEIKIGDLSVCYYCKSTGLSESDTYCPHCGFPQRGTQQEMRIFLMKIRHRKELLEEQRGKVRKARNVLFFVGGAQIVVGLILALTIQINVMAILLIQTLLGALFIGLGFWCNKNPFAAILTGFFAYVILIVINAVLDPVTIIQGIIWKVFIISAFVYGYRAVKDAEKLETELAGLKTAVNLNDEVPELSEGKQE